MYQVIIQGLRESGVFASVIASAQTNLSRKKFLASIEKSNTTRAVPSESLPSRKVSTSRVHQATVRKILDYEDDSHEAAVPPLSPPGAGDSYLVEEA